MAPYPLRLMDPTDAANEADSAAVAELVAVFDSSRLTRQRMALSDLLGLHHAVGDLEECTKVVGSWVMQGDFDGLWAKAYSAGVVVSAQTLTLRDLFRFRNWVISPSGQASLRAFQREQKTKAVKKGKDDSEQEQERRMALVRLYTAQKEDRAARIAASRAERDKKVARLRRKIERARKKHEDAAANIREKYHVVAGYVAPDAAFVQEQCWNTYVAECQAEGWMPPLFKKNARDLEERYGQLVRDRHLLAYLRRPGVKEALLAYGREKLLRLRDQGNHRGFTSFRGLLEIASGGSFALPEMTSARGEDSEEVGVGDGGEGDVAQSSRARDGKGKGNRKRKHISALLAENTLKKRRGKQLMARS